MPKKLRVETQQEQSRRFKRTVADMISAGELDPDEAEKAFEKLMRVAAPERPASKTSKDRSGGS